MAMSYSGEKRGFAGTESRELEVTHLPTNHSGSIPQAPNTANRPEVTSHRLKALLSLLLFAKLLSLL